mmetsp:Transcript_53685/g.85413  ORF Transcript_53685/g.85413 Transcript_53685/m.85413 type:complete len:962 (+) Transcript_53685:99-2984(+)
MNDFRLFGLHLALAAACEAASWKFLSDQSLHTIRGFDVRNSSAATQPDIVEEAADDLRKDAEETYDKAVDMKKKMSLKPHEIIEEDFKLMATYLFPGLRISFKDNVPELLVALISILWFVIFMRYFFKHDLAHEEREIEEKEKEDIEGKRVESKSQHRHHGPNAVERCMADHVGSEYYTAPEADVVIVCYNPACPKYSDNETLLARTTLQRTVGEKSHLLRRTQQLLVKSSRHQSFSKRLTHSFSRNLGYATEHDDEEELDSSNAETLRAARQALLQDLYEVLPMKGFSVTIFNSIDKDELFLCITLRDEDVMRHTLASQGTTLQIQHHVVEHLGIDQSPDDVASSPPYIKYDHRLPTHFLGDDSTDNEFYRTFDGPGSKKTIMMSTDRIRTINKCLNEMVMLDAAVDNNLIVRWFPAHTKDGLVKLRKDWANYRLVTDLTCVQPLNLMREYFGSRVAFLFAWNGCYCKMLIALVPVSIGFYLAYSFSDRHQRSSLFGYGIVIAIWTRLALNTWNRQQDFLVSFWELKSVKKDGAKRPQFFGTSAKSPVDGNLVIKAYPEWKLQLRKAASWFVTAVFCTINSLALIMWIHSWKGRLSIAASIVLAILIQAFTLIFNWLGEVLTEFENHELHLTYYNSYLMKMFVSQFVNQFSAFFYIAIKQQFTPAGCPAVDGQDNDCIGLLNFQLPVTLMALTCSRVVMAVVASLQVKFRFWYEDFQMRRQGLPAVPRTFLEEQGKFGPFRVREQVEATVQIALTLGYVLIFGAVAPRIALLSLIVFMVQLRSGACILTMAATRTLPRKAMGIGRLGPAVELLGVIGMAFSSYLLVNFAPVFQGAVIVARVSSFLFSGMGVYLLWFIVDFVYPPTSEKVELLEERRRHVRRKLEERHSDALYKKVKATHGSSGDLEEHHGHAEEHAQEQDHYGQAEHAKQVQDAAWDDIPRIVDAPRVVEGVTRVELVLS